MGQSYSAHAVRNNQTSATSGQQPSTQTNASRSITTDSTSVVSDHNPISPRPRTKFGRNSFSKLGVRALFSRRRRSNDVTGLSSGRVSSKSADAARKSKSRRWPLTARKLATQSVQLRQDDIADDTSSSSASRPPVTSPQSPAPPNVSTTEQVVSLGGDPIHQRSSASVNPIHDSNLDHSNSDTTAHLQVEPNNPPGNQSHVQDVPAAVSRSDLANAETTTDRDIQPGTAGRETTENVASTQPTLSSERHEEAANNAPSTEAQSGAEPARPRGLPPSGTLIVVQGIVHTSDNPRSPSTSSPSTSSPNVDGPVPNIRTAPSSELRSTNTGQAQSSSSSHRGSRLISQLLRRRNSMTHSPEQSQSNDESHANPERNSTSSTTTADIQSAQDASNVNPSRSPAESVATAPPTNTPIQRSASHDMRTQMNSNSVDVLGALLSVATAATAASLLTVSPTQTATSQPNIPQPFSTMGPMLSLTRALASANPLAAAALIHRNRERNGDAQNRAQPRSIWDSLRERFVPGRSNIHSGLQRSADGDASPSLSRTREATDDATESLFNELARAFNLAVDQQGANPVSPVSHAQTPPRTSPASASDVGSSTQPNARASVDEQADSFEQFLVTLQRDLRAAFTQLSAGNSAATSETTIQRDNLTGDTSNAAAAVEERNVADLSSNPGESSTNIVNDVDRSLSVPVDVMPEPLGEATNANAATENVGHVGASGTRDESGEPAQPSTSTSAPASHTESSSPAVNTGTPSPNSTSPHARPINQGAISWWRVHRFAPMQARNVQQQSQRAPSGSQIPASDTAPGNEPTQNTASSNRDDDEIVVPVIVVGLRSRGLTTTGGPVHQDANRPEREHAENTGGQRANTHSPSSSTFPFVPPSQPSAETPAADTAPPNSAPSTSGNTTGLQTFFIYVFGGYYPPNHRIVNNPDNLESFDALWELMDMLGTPRLPVASEDDIEKAGLEIFKAKSMQEYEQSGKMASISMENCPICLDEYDPEDDLRLLKCKHAFHKACVDQWLKTGRNSCPACRSTGVPVGNTGPQPTGS